MIQQRTLLGEGFATDFTLEGLDASVHTHVSVQVALLCEGLAAQEAHEQLVHFEVVGVVLQLAEYPGTFGALVVPLGRFVIVPLVPGVFLCRRGANWASGHARWTRHFTATTVHSGVDEGVLGLRRVKWSRATGREVPGDGVFRYVQHRLHFYYRDVTLQHTLPWTAALGLGRRLGLYDHIVIVVITAVVLLHLLHFLPFLLNGLNLRLV